ncbi:MAG: PAS domain S-box protein [Acidobacteria bacterium]|nr:PAS domain S-box protein [Acidobacteriota bacterium]
MEKQYLRMMELSPDAVLVHTAGTIVYANEAAVRLFGALDRSEIVGRRVMSFVHPDSREAVQERIRALSAEQDVVPLAAEKLLDLRGRTVDVEVVGFAIQFEGQPSVQVIARDLRSRMRQQEVIRRSEVRYRGLLDGTSDFVFRLTPGGRIVELNSAMATATGWPADTLLGLDIFTIVADSSQSLLRTALLRGRRERLKIEIELRAAEGRLLQLEMSIAPDSDHGVPDVLNVVARDVTVNRWARHEIEERERLLSAVLEQLPVGVLIADRTGRVVRANAAADELWGGCGERILDGELSEVASLRAVAPTRTEVKDSVLRALEDGEMTLDQSIDIDCPPGDLKNVRSSVIPLKEAEEVVGVVVIGQDLTEQRRSARQREAMHARLQYVISATADGICTIDENGAVTLVNPAAIGMLGCSEAEILGRNFHVLVHDGGATDGDDPFLQVIRTRKPRMLLSERFLRCDGTTMDTEVTCSPIIVHEGVIGAVIAFRDVTRRNETQREFEQVQRMSSLGQMAATVAHEFNNIMMGIMPFMEVIGRRAGVDGTMRSATEEVNRALFRAKQVTSEILKFAQSAPPHPKPLVLSTLFEEAFNELRGVAGPAVVVRVTPPEPRLAIFADEVQIRQILTNLVANARDAMPRGGLIEISAIEWEEDSVRIQVRDHGTGMDDATLARIFEPLFTTKKSRGTGLGLAVVHRLVSLHGGRVLVDSALGKGTSFDIILPRTQSVAERAPESAAFSHDVRKILLVEDDEIVAAGLAAILELDGIEVKVVAQGSEVVAAIQADQPDAVVLDRGLPDMDGADVARTIVKRWPDLPLVLATGHGGRRDIEDLLDIPSVGYLLKPFTADALLLALSRLGEKAS